MGSVHSRRWIAATVVWATCSPVSVRAGERVEDLLLSPTQDSWFQDEGGDSRDENLGALELLAIGGRWRDTIFRGVLEFDLSSLPVNAEVLDADLSLFHALNAVEGDNVNTVSVYSLARPWTESDVTWNDAAADSPWSLPGASAEGEDRDDVPLSSVSFTAETPIGEYVDFDVRKAVEETAAGTRTHYGFILLGAESGPLEERYFNGFWSREAVSDPPLLQVTYAVTTFRRGDIDGDGVVNISDPIRVLEYLFSGGTDLTCRRSADSDDDGVVNISDPIRLLTFLFSGGPAPAAPFEACGVDTTADGLGCEVSTECP